MENINTWVHKSWVAGHLTCMPNICESSVQLPAPSRKMAPRYLENYALLH